MTISRALRRSAPLIAIYAAIAAAWATLAFWVVPEIIARAGHAGSNAFLNWVFNGFRWLPNTYSPGPWREIATALLIAIPLHFALVLYITRWGLIDPPTPAGAGRDEAGTNFALITFSAIFLAATAISGTQGDFGAYLEEWSSILQGNNPWSQDHGAFNAYGPLFNLLAPFVVLSPLANKLLFAFCYLVYVTWVVKTYLATKGRQIPLLLFGLILYNLFPWEQIAYYGHFDILIGLFCVASLHSLTRKNERRSGLYLACGILLKYVPVVILPFLAFNGRRFSRRLVGVCAGVVTVGLMMSVLLWGPSTFAPLLFAAERRPVWSVYNLTDSALSPFRSFLNPSTVVHLAIPLITITIFSLFILYRRMKLNLLLSCAMAIILLFLFYTESYVNYQMVLFCLLSYWAMTDWPTLRERPGLAILLVAYFDIMAIADFQFWQMRQGILQYTFRAHVVLFTQFFLGLVLLAGLFRASLRPTSDRNT